MLIENMFLCINAHVGSLLRVQLQGTEALEWGEDVWIRERVLPWTDVRGFLPATGHTSVVIKNTPSAFITRCSITKSTGLFECEVPTYQHTDRSQWRHLAYFRRRDQVSPRIHRRSHHLPQSSEDSQQPDWTTSSPNSAGVWGHNTTVV